VKEEGKGVPLEDSDEESKIDPAINSREVRALKDLVTKLQHEVKRKDNEVTILVSHLNKNKGISGSSVPVTSTESQDDPSADKKMTFYQQMMTKKESFDPSDTKSYTTATNEESKKSTTTRVEEILKNDSNLVSEVKLDKEDMVDKTKAFDKFRKSYRKSQALEENKSILKEKMNEGKNTGRDAKEIKDEMRSLTSKIEELRREKAMRGMVDDSGNIMKSDEEDQLQTKLQDYKSKYMEKYSLLKTLKAEIDRLRNQIDRCWNQLQKDFENWYKMYTNNDTKNPLGMSKDKQVQDDLKAFYEARDKIHKN